MFERHRRNKKGLASDEKNARRLGRKIKCKATHVKTHVQKIIKTERSDEKKPNRLSVAKFSRAIFMYAHNNGAN